MLLSPGAGLHLLVNAVTLSRWLPRHPEAPLPWIAQYTPPTTTLTTRPCQA